MSNANEIFGDVVCISLKKRADRRRALRKNLKACNWAFKQPRFFTAVTPDDVKMPKYFRGKPTEYAALVSHGRVALQARLAHERGELTLILEDDVKFEPDYFERFKRFMNEVPDNWDALWLGYYPSGLAPTPLTPHVAVARHFWGLHCYVVREKMLSEWLKRLGSMCISVDHAFSSMCGEYKVYCPTEPLAKQASGYSDVTGSVRKLD